MRPLIVVVSRRADRNIEAADRWWKESRDTSDAIRDELSWIVGLLLLNPYMGEIAENARRPGLRHFYLEVDTNETSAAAGEVYRNIAEEVRQTFDSTDSDPSSSPSTSSSSGTAT